MNQVKKLGRQGISDLCPRNALLDMLIKEILHKLTSAVDAGGRREQSEEQNGGGYGSRRPASTLCHGRASA